LTAVYWLGHTVAQSQNWRSQAAERTDGVNGEPPHISPAQLAERLGVPLETVYRWQRLRAGGPQFMRVGRHVRYRVADVIAWENSRLVGSRTA
jgi:excisionase family DNA binding protein